MHATDGSGTGRPEVSPQLLQGAAARFGMLASTMRLHIMWVLAHEDMDVGGLADVVGGALPAVSQQLAKLKLAGLVQARREGRRMVYVAADPQVVAMVRLAVEQAAATPAAQGQRGVMGRG
ncbi:MAG TPA: metalloregulator ArsR/SmtB family transcription factor [Streptosporangiaceae bacterium]|nr:metalloregulator ArsR/SmtB family transcription factor [Streptosporangiaceae bacterium]